MRLKKFSFLTVLFFISSSNLAVDCMIEPDALLQQQLISHGAPVQSVSWCCNPLYPTTKYAAIGGYLGTGDVYARVYNLNRTTGMLEEKATLPGSDGLPENWVNSVDWCCQFNGGQSDPALAVGGADGMVHVFSYDGTALTYRATFTHGAEIHAVSWLCNCCTNRDFNYLAIAGEEADNKEIRVLEFDSLTPELTEVAGFRHGNTVFSLDWCCVNVEVGENRAYLAAAGKPSALGGLDCCGPNLRVFCLQCVETGVQAPFTLVTSEAVTCTYLRAVRWCGCDEGLKYPKLAVGGVPENGTSGNNAWLYYLVNSRKLVQVASTTVAGEPGQEGLRIFAIDWNPSCNCTHLTFGGGCQPQPPCFHNIFVYKQDKCNLNKVFSLRYDDNVRALEWCADNGISYLLVGTEINNWGLPEMCEEGVPEVILYKAAFCKPVAMPICLRAPW